MSQVTGYESGAPALANLYATGTYSGAWANSVVTAGLVTVAGDVCGGAGNFPCAKYDVTSQDSPALLVGNTFKKGRLLYTTAEAVNWADVTSDTTVISMAMLCGDLWRMGSLGAVTFKDDAAKLCYKFDWKFSTTDKRCYFCDGLAATTSHVWFNEFVSPVYAGRRVKDFNLIAVTIAAKVLYTTKVATTNT